MLLPDTQKLIDVLDFLPAPKEVAKPKQPDWAELKKPEMPMVVPVSDTISTKIEKKAYGDYIEGLKNWNKEVGSGWDKYNHLKEEGWNEAEAKYKEELAMCEAWSKL